MLTFGVASGALKRGESLCCQLCGTGDPQAFKTPRSRTCTPCKKTRAAAYMKQYGARNIEDIKSTRAEYRRAHASLVAEQKRRYSETHRDHIKAKNAAYYEANAERAKAKSRAHYNETGKAARAVDPEHARRKARSWTAANPEKCAAYHAKWTAKNPGIMAHHAKVRRARMVGVETSLTMPEWNEILVSFGHVCAYCRRAGLKLTQDHVVPISAGGPHAASNIVPACGRCNSRKGDRSVLSMLRYAA